MLAYPWQFSGERRTCISKNASYLKAKKEKNDEFYTQLEDIEAELGAYSAFLNGKSIYLPCDDPYQSNFFTYFVQNFKRLGLRELVATCYDAHFSQLSLFEDYDDNNALIVKKKKAYKAVIRQVGESIELEALLKNPANSLTLLEGNGDFASEECIEIMKAADVVVTNPPFSLFRHLIHLLSTLNKDYVLLGPSQAIAYSEVFALFQAKNLKLGHTAFAQSMAFEVPPGKPYDKAKKGHYYKQVLVAWFTSFQVERHIVDYRFKKRFKKEEAVFLDNEPDILNIDSLAELPVDYKGMMAVPVTFLRVWQEEGYELLGKLDKPMVSGQEKFTRLLIQKKKRRKINVD